MRGAAVPGLIVFRAGPVFAGGPFERDTTPWIEVEVRVRRMK
jgi:hypothetical protein